MSFSDWSLIAPSGCSKRNMLEFPSISVDYFQRVWTWFGTKETNWFLHFKMMRCSYWQFQFYQTDLEFQWFLYAGVALPFRGFVGSSALVKFLLFIRLEIVQGLRASTVWRYDCFLFGVVFNPESRVVTTFSKNLCSVSLVFAFWSSKLVAEGFNNKTRCCSLQKMNIEDNGKKSDTTILKSSHLLQQALLFFVEVLVAITRQHPLSPAQPNKPDHGRSIISWLTKLAVWNEQNWSLKTPQNGA